MQNSLAYVEQKQMRHEPERLSPDERKRVGQKLRVIRQERGLDQRVVARAAKVSLGTLQMIERGAGRNVRPGNLAKVAAYLGSAVDVLREERDDFKPGDPLLTGLNREDLMVARRFHDAILEVRLVARAALTLEGDELRRERCARLVMEIFQIADDVELIGHLTEIVRAANAVSVEVIMPSVKK